MNIKNTAVSLKKLPYHLSLILLTAGASLILGFLSFGGMYALTAFLPLAFAAFALSVAYEGEIYLQNIKGALNKLFKNNYLKNLLAKEFLLTPGHFPSTTQDKECPKFFQDYEKLLQALHAFEHKEHHEATELNAASKKRKKQIEKNLDDMEKWFALQLFPTKNKTSETESKYSQDLRLWLEKKPQQQWQDRLKSRQSKFKIVKAFSIFAGLFMGLGSTYLIVEAFSVMPFFATISFSVWPLMILPMAAIAGTAYGMLTFNTVTDLINNNTVMTWYNKLRQNLSQGYTLYNVGMTALALFLAGLALSLTVCTAGTWWTVAKNAQPLFGWMRQIPSFVMGIINPVITGLSAIFFNIQNTGESLKLVEEQLEPKEPVKEEHSHQQETKIGTSENWLQLLNPFRIILKITILPLRIILFLGHLISIAVTSDRMPGVSQRIAAIIAMISEGFEDAHYFIGHSHKQEAHSHETKHLLQERLGAQAGHHHNMDIPSKILETIALPLYFLATLWDFATSAFNKSSETNFSKKALSFKEAWNKQRGIKKETDVALDNNPLSLEWQKEHSIALIEQYQTTSLEKTSFDHKLAQQKMTKLNELKDKIRSSTLPLAELLAQETKETVYNQHRLFATNKTRTQEFIEALPRRISLRAN